MMDTDEEFAKLKLLLVAGVMFLVSCYVVYEELIYFARGRKIEAVVTQVREVVSTRRFRKTRHLQVEYRFTEPDSTSRTGSDSVGPEWESTPSVAVQYTPGTTGRSRLAGSVNWIGLLIFAACTTWLGLAGYSLYREATEDLRGSSPRRKF